MNKENVFLVVGGDLRQVYTAKNWLKIIRYTLQDVTITL